MPRKTGKTGPKTTGIAAAVGAPLPEADTERLASQIAALKLLPAHARGLLAHLQTHPDALTSGEATGPSYDVHRKSA